MHPPNDEKLDRNDVVEAVNTEDEGGDKVSRDLGRCRLIAVQQAKK
jgi:hypothetical protein